MEILVSAAIVSFSIIAIIAVIRKGREIDINDLHRRQARLIITALLESPQYQIGSYSNIVTPSETQSTVTLDPRGGVPLNATLTIKATAGTQTSSFGTIPVKQVHFCVSWDEPGFRDSVTIDKWIADN